MVLVFIKDILVGWSSVRGCGLLAHVEDCCFSIAMAMLQTCIRFHKPVVISPASCTGQLAA